MTGIFHVKALLSAKIGFFQPTVVEKICGRSGQNDGAEFKNKAAGRRGKGLIGVLLYQNDRQTITVQILDQLKQLGDEPGA